MSDQRQDEFLNRADGDTDTLKHVLDHGLVRLVSYMQPVPETVEQRTGWNDGEMREAQPKDWTGDLEIVRNARVSYDADWRTGEEADKDEKLIRYLMVNGHTTPFEAMVFTFEVLAPIFVFRQWHRHRTWSYNEVSARYAVVPEMWYSPRPEHIGVQATSSKQSRVFLSPVDGKPIEGFVPPGVDYVPGAAADPLGIARSAYDQQKAEAMANSIDMMCQASYQRYQDLIATGVPREVARGVLPFNTYSRMFATVDLHNLMHFLFLRLHPHAQYEIRVYAEAIVKLIASIVPVAMKYFERERRA